MSFYQHETAIIDEGAVIGNDSQIWHWVHICGTNTVIGQACSLGQNVFVANNVQIGNRVKIQNNVSVYDSVILEDDVFCGPSMVFTNVINPRSAIERKNEYKTTLVKKGATLGANSTVICGNTIGEYALIAAGAVITKDVPAFSLMAGIPAQRLGWTCQCGVTLTKEKAFKGKIQCKDCLQNFNIDQNSCSPTNS